STPAYLNNPPHHHHHNSTNIPPSSGPREPVALSTPTSTPTSAATSTPTSAATSAAASATASSGRCLVEAQRRLPSHKTFSDTDIAIQQFLDRLITKYQQQQQSKKQLEDQMATVAVESAKESSGVNINASTIFVTDLVPAPPLTDDSVKKSLSKMFQERQKEQLAGFMAKMACHLLYSNHNKPELLEPTQELEGYCAYAMDAVIANAIVMDPAEMSAFTKLMAADSELE
ncbi:hypothetical protein BGZ96_003823, partial [Linnemannia gamsii]